MVCMLPFAEQLLQRDAWKLSSAMILIIDIDEAWMVSLCILKPYFCNCKLLIILWVITVKTNINLHLWIVLLYGNSFWLRFTSSIFNKTKKYARIPMQLKQEQKCVIKVLKLLFCVQCSYFSWNCLQFSKLEYAVLWQKVKCSPFLTN